MFLTEKKTDFREFIKPMAHINIELELCSDSSDLFSYPVSMLFAIRHHSIPSTSAHSCNQFYHMIHCAESLTCLLWEK
jgi:hypothetical protein